MPCKCIPDDSQAHQMLFPLCCYSENKFKVSFLKAMGRVCSELLRAAQNLFLSPTVCAAGCFTVNVQSLLDGARLERTDSKSNEHGGETLVLFDFTPQHCWNGDASCAACLSCLTFEPAHAWIHKHWCSTCACSEWCWVPGLDLCREHAAAAPEQ